MEISKVCTYKAFVLIIDVTVFHNKNKKNNGKR